MAVLHDVQAEQEFLGAVLVDNSVLGDRHVAPHHFYDPVHQRLLEMIQSLAADDRLASPNTMRHLLENEAALQELGGARYLVRLAGNAVVSQAKEMARIIVDLWAKREVSEAAAAAGQALEQGAPLSSASAALQEAVSGALEQSGRAPVVRSWSDVLLGAFQASTEAYQNDGATGVQVGVPDLDQMLGGLHPSNLTVLAGRPSMGKTAVALAFAVHAARAGEPVIFASLEMSGDEIGQRFMSMMAHEGGTRVPYEQLRRGKQTEAEFRATIEASRALDDLPILMIEKDARDLHRLQAAIGAAAKKRPPALIVVDYLQRIVMSGNMSTYERVTAVVGAMKALAVKHECPVLCLSQLSRKVEDRDPPIPQLSDLRDSGAIEEDADQAILVYRPEYYLERRTPSSSEEIDKLARAKEMVEGQVDLIVAKNRHGRIGTVRASLDVATNFLAPPAQDDLW